MKLKHKQRWCSFILAVMMLLPVFYTPASATPAEIEYLAQDNFNGYELGASLETGSVFAELPTHYEIMNENENNYFRLYLDSPTDKGGALVIPRAKDTTTKIVVEQRIRYVHGSGVDSESGQFQMQIATSAGTYKSFCRFKTSGSKAWDVDLVSGASSIAQNQWYEIKFILDPATGTFEMYLNGDLYATDKDNFAATDFTVERKYTFAKASKVDSTGTSYVDVDDVKVYYMPSQTCTVTLDGVEQTVQVGTTLNLSVEEKQFLWAKIETADGTTMTKTPSVTIMMDTVITTRYGDRSYLGYLDFDATTVLNDYVRGDSGFANGCSVVTEQNGNQYLEIDYAQATSKVKIWDMDFQAPPANTAYVIELSYLITKPDATCGAYITVIDNSTGVAGGGWPNVIRLRGDGAIFFDTVNNSEVFYKIPQNEWTSVRIYIDPVRNVKDLYINDQLIISGVQFAAYAGHKTDRMGIVSTYWNGNDRSLKLGVDNFRMYLAEGATVTVNGEEKTVPFGSALDLSEAGKKILYAKITKSNGDVSYTQETSVGILENDLTIEAVYLGFETLTGASVRINSPIGGIRFVSAVNAADFEALKAMPNVESVRIGTLIAPQRFIAAAGAFTREALEDRFTIQSYVDIAATDGCWYGGEQVENCYVFAGSLVGIKASNYNAMYSGTGYIEVTLTDGTVQTLYGGFDSERHTRSVAYVAKCALEDSQNNFTEEQREALRVYADAYAESASDQYAKDLQGLNVLAIGDSLFRGHELLIDSQWINLMGKECSWNLTNLGINGASVSYNEGQTKRSMYNLLMNDSTYRFNGNAEDVDLILFEGGYNDYGMDVRLGTVDSNDPTTFLGAWNCVVEKLLTIYPNATVVFVTPWQLSGYNSSRTDDPIVTYLEFTTSINRLYEEKYSENPRVRIIDAGDPVISGINMDSSEFRAVYGWTANDRFHLNAAGMEVMRDNMYPQLHALVESLRAKA